MCNFPELAGVEFDCKTLKVACLVTVDSHRRRNFEIIFLNHLDLSYFYQFVVDKTNEKVFLFLQPSSKRTY